MDIAAFAQRLAARLALTDETGHFAALFMALTRELAKGRPVAPAALADRLGWPLGRVAAALQRAPGIERDDDGRIAGYGLTLRETPYACTVGGRRLYTWCAFDSLFFPYLLSQSAHVTSRCAATGAAIALTVDRAAIRDLQPAETVVSLLLPDESTDIRTGFCCHVRFFESRAAGQSWAAEHPTVEIMSAADTFVLARASADVLLRHHAAAQSGKGERIAP